MVWNKSKAKTLLEADNVSGLRGDWQKANEPEKENKNAKLNIIIFHLFIFFSI